MTSNASDARKAVATDHDAYGYSKNWRTALPQILAVSAKNLILIAFGTTLGFSSILIPALQKNDNSSRDLTLNAIQISWIGSINLICVPLGCLLSGAVTSPIGRKRSMQMVNVPFITAWSLFYFSTSVPMLYSALALSGLAGGLLEAPVLTYVAEITQPHLRGILSATSTMSIIVGIFIQLFLGTLFDWRTITLINMSIPVTAIIALCFIPESPYWLLSKGRNDDAKKSLRWLRGWTRSQAIEAEYYDLYELINKLGPVKTINGDIDNKVSDKTKLMEKLSHFGKRSFLYPYSLVSIAFFVGHFCGMTTLQTYSVLLFATLRAPLDKYLAALILGAAQLVGTLGSVGLIHFTGKRPLAFLSMAGTAVCFFITGCYAYYLQMSTGVLLQLVQDKNSTMNVTQTGHNNMEDMNGLSWIPITFLVASALFSHVGIRILPWVLIGEVYSPETRSAASGLSGGTGYIFQFLANKVFLDMVSTLSLPGTFWVNSAISIVGIVILYFILPETEGHTLNAISQHFSGVKRLPKNMRRVHPASPLEINLTDRKAEKLPQEEQVTRRITVSQESPMIPTETENSRL